jgi:hypothetical protein
MMEAVPTSDMTEEEAIHVADVSEGMGGDATAEPGSPVELPVVDVLTGRSFITGKSGSGKSNTASVVIENLLSNGLPVMIVDTDGEYYGLKEAYEILHAGADDECDIVVSPEHAEKLATLALEQNVPIILDVSGYLEESVANELLLEVTKHLFAKEKRLKKPFLLVVEECHEYIPEGGGMDETGKMLIKVGKRGRKHGLGIVGISQRPADVKKDFITQCDWLCWHRLTWDNDTKVVGRILGSTYASAVEDLRDGEAFLMTDWDESIRRIQFHRKQTFDAGATPGLDDFERPELKSVSDDLVGDLQSISEENARRESELADLRQELEKRDQQIRQLERELEDARDLSTMADQFAQALLGKAGASYRGGPGGSIASQKRAAQADLEACESADDDAGASAETKAHGAAEQKATAAESDDRRTVDEDGRDVDGDKRDLEADASENPIELVTRDDVVAEALRFDDAVELGTREAVIEELKGRVASLPTLSRDMLRHYRREGTSEPVAAHIDAGGDGDRGHAYSRHRPIRTAGLIRHAGEGRYVYAVPDLVRDAYADRLDEPAVEEMVQAVETAFVSPDERSTLGNGLTSSSGEWMADELSATTDESDVLGDESHAATDRSPETGDAEDAGDASAQSFDSSGLSEAARRLATKRERSKDSSE